MYNIVIDILIRYEIFTSSSTVTIQNCYSIANYIPYAYVTLTYLFYSWKFVFFDLPHPFFPLPPPCLWQPAICSLYLKGLDFCVVFLESTFK